MKKLFIVFLLCFTYSQIFGVPPTYQLSLRNFSNPTTTTVEFDMYILWTNPGSDPFEYGSCQYCVLSNDACRNGATWTFTKIGSDMPSNLQPGLSYSAASGEIRYTGNLPSPGFVVSSTFPGTKVVRTRISSSVPITQQCFWNLRWKYTGSGLVVKVSYLDPNGTGIFITDGNPANNLILDTAGALPVELSSFTSSVNRNNVTLNWSTTKETNNQGFDIERAIVNSNTWTKVGSVNGNGNTNETKNYNYSERISTGKFNYRLKQIDFNGNFEYFNLGNEVEVGIPSAYAISQNYPNPFNPTTKIDYDIPFDGKVSILLYDISGREVGNLVNDVKTAGYYTIQFNASNLASGMYFYRISAEGNGNNFVSTKKMVLIK
jgi:hypothetical protein